MLNRALACQVRRKLIFLSSQNNIEPLSQPLECLCISVQGRKGRGGRGLKYQSNRWLNQNFAHGSISSIPITSENFKSTVPLVLEILSENMYFTDQSVKYNKLLLMLTKSQNIESNISVGKNQKILSLFLCHF